MDDVWGRIFLDHLRGDQEPYHVERDDGLRHLANPAVRYFEPPCLEGERTLLERLRDPVLDLGAGAGSYALYLQSLGLEVTAADFSPGAREVCRRRGCRDVEDMDLRKLHLGPGCYESVIVMGNTLGAHQTHETLPTLMAALRHGVRLGGHLLCTLVDPLDTTEPVHLEYHERNRKRGLPPGLTQIRMTYRGVSDEWIYLWMPTTEELIPIASDAGWELMEELPEGPLQPAYRLRTAADMIHRVRVT
jgi:SAM-dependent methyltransferase